MMIFKQFSNYSRNAYGYLFSLGLLLVLFGILLLIMPELLAYLISFFFILIGVILLSMALKIKRTEKSIRSKVEHVAGTFKDHTGQRDFNDF